VRLRSLALPVVLRLPLSEQPQVLAAVDRYYGGALQDPHDRPLASAQAEMGVREDGRAIGDHGQKHMGLGVPTTASGDATDAFSAFRNRAANSYKDKITISKANLFSHPQS